MRGKRVVRAAYKSGALEVNRLNARWLALLLILLLAAFLRFRGIDPMHTMLHHDEAYYGLDALSLLENPRLTPFFPNNTGRESLWMYLLAPSIGVFGATPFALRIATMFIGVLTVAAMYPFARELLGRRDALWATAAYAVLYWAVQMHHIAFRTNLYPLVGLLALTFLLRAYRKNTWHLWLWAGFTSGLLIYTYTAARGWVAFIWLTLLVMAFTAQKRRRGALVALILSGIVALPLGLHALNEPLIGVEGLSRTAVLDANAILDNIQRWLGAWLYAGDPLAARNLDAKPILSAPLAICASIGLVVIWGRLRTGWLRWWLLGLALVAVAPSLVTVDAPHYVRGLGLLVPTALVLGAGAAWLAQRRVLRSMALPFVIGLFVWAAADTLLTLNAWLSERRLLLYIDDRVNLALAAVRDHTPPDMPLYIPGLDFHPVAAYHAANLPRHTAFYPFADGDCFITANETTAFVDLPIVLNSFVQRVQPYAEAVAVLASDYEAPHVLWQVVQVTPNTAIRGAWSAAPVLGEMLQIALVEPLNTPVQRGERLALQVGMRLLRPVDKQYHLFLHLQGDPTPYEGGTLWATGDGRLCTAITDESRLTALADTSISETLVQLFYLDVPPDLPAGDYHVAVGLYDFESQARLSTQIGGVQVPFYELVRFTVMD